MVRNNNERDIGRDCRGRMRACRLMCMTHSCFALTCTALNSERAVCAQYASPPSLPSQMKGEMALKRAEEKRGRVTVTDFYSSSLFSRQRPSRNLALKFARGMSFIMHKHPENALRDLKELSNPISSKQNRPHIVKHSFMYAVKTRRIRKEVFQQ